MSLGSDCGSSWADAWDREAFAAFALAPGLEQPHLSVVKDRAEIERAFRGEIPVPSCRVHAIDVAP